MFIGSDFIWPFPIKNCPIFSQFWALLNFSQNLGNILYFSSLGVLLKAGPVSHMLIIYRFKG